MGEEKDFSIKDLASAASLPFRCAVSGAAGTVVYPIDLAIANAPQILGNAIQSGVTTSVEDLNPLQRRIDDALGIGEDALSQLSKGQKLLCEGSRLVGAFAVPAGAALKGYKLAKTFAQTRYGEKGVQNLKRGTAVIGSAYIAGQGVDGVNLGLNLLH